MKKNIITFFGKESYKEKYKIQKANTQPPLARLQCRRTAQETPFLSPGTANRVEEEWRRLGDKKTVTKRQ